MDVKLPVCTTVIAPNRSHLDFKLCTRCQCKRYSNGKTTRIISHSKITWGVIAD